MRLCFFFILSLLWCQRFSNESIGDGTHHIVVDYYSNGNIKSKVSFNHENVMDGVSELYYKSGIIESRVNFENGHKGGPCYYYYENGELSMYCHYNGISDGSAMYLREYDQASQIILERGSPIVIITDINSQKIKTGQFFDYKIMFTVPPNCIGILNNYVKTRNSEYTFASTYKMKENIPLFRHFIDSIGMYEFRVVSELNDTIRENIRRDTIDFEINVTH